MTRTFVLASILLFAAAVPAVPPDPINPDPKGLRPIAAEDTIWIEEMTWMEVRDALAAGKTTVLIPTGGVEQNGPYLATGKHNYILRATGEAIARKLGNTLVAPIVPFVPEGDFEPPTVHMKYPGTITLTEETFQRLLIDICTSFEKHGFRDIVLIGDSGGNQDGMKAVAEKLNKKWAGKTRVLFIPEYYDYPGVEKWLEKQGIKQTAEGFHDDFAITAQMMAVNPATVRAKQRQAAGNFNINGIDLVPVEKTAEWGRKIIDFRADTTVKAIRIAMGNNPKPR
ncbi:MAG TPA: creatininase family protein [Urbifossiella sp.]|jgi:creatinine amidohydrolase/Fe(II)-dependent formamide hydrolase-like protein